MKLIVHANYTPRNMNYPNSFSHSMPMDRSSDIREEKVLKFLERQNAVIEKLAIRIQQEERESMQREKKELEQKLRDLQTEKILRQQEDSMRYMSKANSEELSRRKSKGHLDGAKSPSKKNNNTLETLGKFYLMSKLFDGNGNPVKSPLNPLNEMMKSRGPETERNRDRDRDRDRDTSIVGELEDEEEEEEPPTPEVKSKSLKKLATQKSMKIQPVVLQPLMLDEFGNMVEPSQVRRNDQFMPRTTGMNGSMPNNLTPPDAMPDYGDTPRNRYPQDYSQDYRYGGMTPRMDPTPRNRYPPDYRYHQSNYPSIQEFMDDGYGYGDPRMTKQMSRRSMIKSIKEINKIVIRN